jgi:hypothetical protein
MKKKDNSLMYAALYLESQNMSVEDIGEELNLTNQSVRNLLKSSKKPKKEVQESSNKKIKTTSAPVNSKNLMITKTESKKINSVAIMTKAASEVNDEFRKGLSETVSRTSKDAIFRPNQNK